MARTKKYTNKSGTSGVKTYSIGRGKITVGFKDGSKYLYTNASAGSSVVSRMRKYAKSGKGLNGYINRSVAYSRYESKY